jgi:hypothetical protein
VNWCCTPLDGSPRWACLGSRADGAGLRRQPMSTRVRFAIMNTGNVIVSASCLLPSRPAATAYAARHGRACACVTPRNCACACWETVELGFVRLPRLARSCSCRAPHGHHPGSQRLEDQGPPDCCADHPGRGSCCWTMLPTTPGSGAVAPLAGTSQTCLARGTERRISFVGGQRGSHDARDVVLLNLIPFSRGWLQGLQRCL